MDITREYNYEGKVKSTTITVDPLDNKGNWDKGLGLVLAETIGTYLNVKGRYMHGTRQSLSFKYPADVPLKQAQRFQRIFSDKLTKLVVLRADMEIIKKTEELGKKW